ncbi:MAG: protein prkA, partial [Pyrinomonadaceae bacterium]|nr:protein prkA [Pyrinomonadaceae bacterium]
MQEQDGNNKFNISERLEGLRREREALKWEGSFRDYFELVTQNPRLAELSHARINDMIHAAGIEKLNEGTRDEVARYNFFAEELFGIEEPIARIVEYFKSAAQRLEVRKRILLLMGPVGGGKSTIVTMLKRGLEHWTQSEEGAVFAIKDCPMHEEPLHLIPNSLRPEIEKHYGIYIEGDLCPQCRYALEHTYHGRHEDVKVERIVFSEKDRIGIGTFAPSDPKSQDITELTGSIDLSTIGEVGVESDPRAYRFDGELNIATRGLMEFVEMLKVDEKFLYSLLTLSQEQNIKTGRFAMIYADEVIVSHTNENEYISFAGNRKSEALQDRIIL